MCILHPLAGAEVELAGGQKLTAKMVILADGVHSKTAAKYHKMPLNILKIGGWRCVDVHPSTRTAAMYPECLSLSFTMPCPSEPRCCAVIAFQGRLLFAWHQAPKGLQWKPLPRQICHCCIPGRCLCRHCANAGKCMRVMAFAGQHR